MADYLARLAYSASAGISEVKPATSINNYINHTKSVLAAPIGNIGSDNYERTSVYYNFTPKLSLNDVNDNQIKKISETVYKDQSSKDEILYKDIFTNISQSESPNVSLEQNNEVSVTDNKNLKSNKYYNRENKSAKIKKNDVLFSDEYSDIAHKNRDSSVSTPRAAYESNNENTIVPDLTKANQYNLRDEKTIKSGSGYSLSPVYKQVNDTNINLSDTDSLSFATQEQKIDTLIVNHNRLIVKKSEDRRKIHSSEEPISALTQSVTGRELINASDSMISARAKKSSTIAISPNHVNNHINDLLSSQENIGKNTSSKKLLANDVPVKISKDISLRGSQQEKHPAIFMNNKQQNNLASKQKDIDKDIISRKLPSDHIIKTMQVNQQKNIDAKKNSLIKEDSSQIAVRPVIKSADCSFSHKMQAKSNLLSKTKTTKISVSIGRVHVKASKPYTAPIRRMSKPAKAAQPSLTLKDYLARYKGDFA